MSSVDKHARCIDALPGYLAGALPPAAVAGVVTHTLECDDCRGELELARRVQTHFAREWQDVAPLLEPAREEAQFDVLWLRVAATDPAHGPTRRRWPATLAAVAATLLLAAGVAWQQQAERPTFRTLADSQPHACLALRVQVSEPTPAFAQVLRASGARVIGGPGLDGVYTVAAPYPAETLRQLQAVPGIERAEVTGC
jgi:Putative zinc-finger